MRRHATRRALITRAGQVPRVGPSLRRLGHEAHLRQLGRRVQPLDGWRFARGSSGPLARELPGEWLTRDQLAGVWEYQLSTLRELNGGALEGLGEWCDIHAAAAAL